MVRDLVKNSQEGVDPKKSRKSEFEGSYVKPENCVIVTRKNEKVNTPKAEKCEKLRPKVKKCTKIPKGGIEKFLVKSEKVNKDVVVENEERKMSPINGLHEGGIYTEGGTLKKGGYGSPPPHSASTQPKSGHHNFQQCKYCSYCFMTLEVLKQYNC